MLLLAGDVGGTKTSLAIYSPEAGPRSPLAADTLSSAHYSSLEALVSDFLAKVNLRPARASFGVAGPVVDGKATITNLPWIMSERQLQVDLNLAPGSVSLLNDLVAIAHAVPWLEADDLYTLNQGQAVRGGATWDGSRYRAHASEGGHTDFAPTDSLEVDLLRYLLDRFGHVSYERVCSGRGLPNIYAFLKDSGYAQEPAWLAERLAAVDDPNPIIVEAALGDGQRCELCVATLKTFASILATEAGNMALNVLATGGVYLGGGIPPRILPALRDSRFLEVFCEKGRMSSLMARIPVHVILNPKIALLGAACRGLEL
jgi:glucokinase